LKIEFDKLDSQNKSTLKSYPDFYALSDEKENDQIKKNYNQFIEYIDSEVDKD
jgi:hypothetical protein